MNKKQKDDYSAIREIYEAEYLEREKKRTQKYLKRNKKEVLKHGNKNICGKKRN